jgi:hypothetical protein
MQSGGSARAIPSGEWVPIDKAMAQAERLDDRPPYPQEWYELADEARRHPSPKRPRYDPRSRLVDEP